MSLGGVWPHRTQTTWPNPLQPPRRSVSACGAVRWGSCEWHWFGALETGHSIQRPCALFATSTPRVAIVARRPATETGDGEACRHVPVTHKDYTNKPGEHSPLCKFPGWHMDMIKTDIMHCALAI